MPRKPSNQPNDVELAILRALWERGPSSVREVHDGLKRSRETGYTSTLKMMQVMLDKGLLERDESARQHIYRPAVPEEQTQRQILSELIQKAFGGSARKLVLRAVESQRIDKNELTEIRDLLKRLERGEQ
jgi:predicted transcriptional regulator